MPFSKEIIGVLVLALLGAGVYVWRMESKLESAQEQIGSLKIENKQLKTTLAESEEESQRIRGEMELWRDLYTQLQEINKEINQEREAQQKRLAELQEQQDVQDYMDCPMPDSLYDWVRQN